MSRKTKLLLLSITLICVLALTGCWDRLEIQERAFVMVVGVDKYDSEKSKVSDKHKVKQNEANKLKVTYVLPKFTAVREGEEGENSRQILTGVGKTPYDITRQLTLRQNSKPFFQHTKAVVLGLDIVKNSDQFLETLDGLERQDEMSRKLYVFVAEDQASDILKVKSLLKPLSYKLEGIPHHMSTNLFVPITLEEVISATTQGATLIPKITASDTEVKIAGSAVIKNNKFLSWLGEEETKAVAFIRGDAKKDIIEINYKGITIPYIISDIKQKKSARIEDGHINIDLKFTIAGNIQQYKVNEKPRFTDLELFKSLEKLINEEITKNLNSTIDTLQNDMNADVIKIGKHLKSYEPKMWEQIEGEWNEIFPKVKINVHMDAFIDKVGSIK